MSEAWNKLQVDRHTIALQHWEGLRDKTIAAVKALEETGQGHLTEGLTKLIEHAETHAALRREELAKLTKG